MANLYGAANHSSSPARDEPDDFSLLLHQIMFRSSSSSSSSFMVQESKEVECTRPSWGPPGNQDFGLQSVVSGSERLPLPEVSSSGGLPWSSGGGVFAAPGTCFPERGVNVSSSSVSVDNDLHEYDCESEGVEGVVDEAIPKPAATRNSSKRSRAAEVHNLSEKRRRSRINEKMKALQNLIPNSNKTDKASMLDEAIDYLKQLQLQVQLLTMRNGLSLYPMCLPGVVQPNQMSDMRIGPGGNKSLNMDFASALPANQTPSNLLFSPPDNYTSHEQAAMVNLPRLNESVSDHSPAPESIIKVHQGVFQFPLPGSSNKEIYTEEKLPCPQPDHREQDISRTKSLENYVGSEATGSFNFNVRASSLNEHSLDASALGKGNTGRVCPSHQLECGKVPTSQGNGVELQPIGDSVGTETR